MSHRVAWGAVGAIVILAAVIGGKAPTSAPLVPDLVHAQANYKYTGAASCGSSTTCATSIRGRRGWWSRWTAAPSSIAPSTTTSRSSPSW